MGSSGQWQRGIFTESLQQALAWSMLPNLDPRDLGRLACTCKAGRDLVMQASPELWQDIAAQVLPGRHPMRQSSEVLTGL